MRIFATLLVGLLLALGGVALLVWLLWWLWQQKERAGRAPQAEIDVTPPLRVSEPPEETVRADPELAAMEPPDAVPHLVGEPPVIVSEERKEQPVVPAEAEVMEPAGDLEPTETAVAESRDAEEETTLPLAVDDLKVIEGIGHKIAAVLRDAGIQTYEQLAATAPARLEEILGEADQWLLRLADPTTWPEQASLAAAGQWEALDALKGELKNGRRS